MWYGLWTARDEQIMPFGKITIILINSYAKTVINYCAYRKDNE
jgi:hypothetical protein